MPNDRQYAVATMSKSPKERSPKPVLTPIGEYIEVQPALHMVRVMNRFRDEVLA